MIFMQIPRKLKLLKVAQYILETSANDIVRKLEYIIHEKNIVI